MRKPSTPLERVGVETFKAEVERRAGIKFEPIRPYEFTGRGDRIGWVKGIDDKWHLTLFIENGRILDYPGRPLKTGLLEIAKIHKRRIPHHCQPEPDRCQRTGRSEGADREAGAGSWSDECRYSAARKLDGLRLLPDLPVGNGGS